jgi:hypothetical protein
MIYGSDICIEQVCVVPVRSKGAVDHKKVLNTGLRKCSAVHPRMRNNHMGLVSDIQIYVIFLLFILVLIFLLILDYMIIFIICGLLCNL